MGVNWSGKVRILASENCVDTLNCLNRVIATGTKAKIKTSAEYQASTIFRVHFDFSLYAISFSHLNSIIILFQPDIPFFNFFDIVLKFF